MEVGPDVGLGLSAYGNDGGAIGRRKWAIDALLMTTEKNRYLRNGHDWQRPNLPCYLPGNGGLLYAVAMMTGGWRGSPTPRAGIS